MSMTGAATDPHHVPCICLEGNGARESHKGDGYKESEVMYTLNTVEQHSVCLNPWDVQSKHIQPESGKAEALYSGECRYGGGESYVMKEEPLSSDEEKQIDEFVKAANQGTKHQQDLIQHDLGVARTLAPGTHASGSHLTKTLCTSRVYGISSYDSNAMKSNNPHSGIYEAETSRTLDLNGGSPACNQGGIAVVQGFAMQAIGEYKDCNCASSLKQRDYKDATDLVVEPKAVMCYGLDRASFNQGQNAQYDFSVEEDLAQTIVSRGPGGVLAQQ